MSVSGGPMNTLLVFLQWLFVTPVNFTFVTIMLQIPRIAVTPSGEIQLNKAWLGVMSFSEKSLNHVY